MPLERPVQKALDAFHDRMASVCKLSGVRGHPRSCNEWTAKHGQMVAEALGAVSPAESREILSGFKNIEDTLLVELGRVVRGHDSYYLLARMHDSSKAPEGQAADRAGLLKVCSKHPLATRVFLAQSQLFARPVFEQYGEVANKVYGELGLDFKSATSLLHFLGEKDLGLGRRVAAVLASHGYRGFRALGAPRCDHPKSLDSLDLKLLEKRVQAIEQGGAPAVKKLTPGWSAF